MTDTKTPRFRQLTLEELDAAQRRIADEIVEYAGGIGGPFNLLLRSAELTDLCFRMGSYLLFSTVLPRPLVEMAILIRARWSNADLEWWAHRRMALEAGLPAAIVEALEAGRRPDAMSEDEAAVYALSVELLKHDRVADATVELVKARFGERGVADITGIVGFYGMVSLILKAADVGAPDGSRLAPTGVIFG